MNQEICNELKGLEETTNKHFGQLVGYYHKCCAKIPFPDEMNYSEWLKNVDGVILDFVRDYAHFDEDNSDMLKNYHVDDDMLFNCCSPYRI